MLKMESVTSRGRRVRDASGKTANSPAFRESREEKKKNKPPTRNIDEAIAITSRRISPAK